MSTVTPNYGFILPAINDPTDQDLWGGMLNSNFESLDTIIKNVADTAGRLPVGSLYIVDGVSTNPSDPSLLGYGTWVAFGTGRMLVSVGSGTDSRGETRAFTSGETGGEYNHAMTAGENGSHTHRVMGYPAGGSDKAIGQVDSEALMGAGVQSGQTYYTNFGDGGQILESSGSGTPHNNMPPYIAVYVWKRTA